MNDKGKIDKKLAAFGEIMMRLNCPNGKRLTDPGAFDVLFGGAEANVCVFLSGLGLSCRFVSSLPDNDLGRAASDRLRSHGVELSALISAKGRMGLYFTENGNMLRPSRVIYDRKDSSFSRLEKGEMNWSARLEDVGWFHWSGISPAVSAGAASVCLEGLLAAKKMGIPISVDLNYRSSLWDYGKHPSSIMPEFVSHCDMLIGDLHSASLYFDIHVNKEGKMEDQFRSCATALTKQFGSLKTIGFSFRNQDGQQRESYQGALLKDGDCYFSPVYFLPQVIDRIGSGDAFGAGLIYSSWNGLNPQESIDFATACGILKHSIYGDFAKVTTKEVNQFIEQGPGSRVIR
jgi:2-dehydro-3-deoxygluconokinase